jgi:hypothetical protein
LVAHENCLVFSLQVSRTLFFYTLLFGNSIWEELYFCGEVPAVIW